MACGETESAGHQERENTEMTPSAFKACYQVQDAGLYANAFSRLPEFTRGKVAANTGEEYIWLAPVNGLGAKPGRPVATIRLSGQTLEIHSESRKGLQALRVLVEELGGSGVRLVSSVSAIGPI